MSKVIQQTNKSIRGQIEAINRTHGAELRSIEQAHVNKKADLKSNHEATIVDLQNENLKSIDAEAQKRERVLGEMKKTVDDAQLRTDKQLKDLKVYTQKESEELNVKGTTERDRLNQQHGESLETLNDKYNDAAREIRYQGQHRITKMNEDEREQLSNLRDFHSERLNDQTTEFNKRYTHDERKYKEFKEVQDRGFKNERAVQNLKQKQDLHKLSNEQKFQLDQRDKLFRKAYKDQDGHFEKKWETQMAGHQQNFKNLDDLHKKVVSKVKSDMTNEVAQMVKRSDDQFYQFTELKPVLTSFPDHVEIKVDVPEHSKQDLQLTTNNKEVVVVFNRRYQDQNKNALGSAKIHRIESFTSRINVDGILDPRSVKSTYDNGTMTYTIKKA